MSGSGGLEELHVVGAGEEEPGVAILFRQSCLEELAVHTVNLFELAAQHFPGAHLERTRMHYAKPNSGLVMVLHDRRVRTVSSVGARDGVLCASFSSSSSSNNNKNLIRGGVVWCGGVVWWVTCRSSKTSWWPTCKQWNTPSPMMWLVLFPLLCRAADTPGTEVGHVLPPTSPWVPEIVASPCLYV